jgi:hypothetical protein
MLEIIKHDLGLRVKDTMTEQQPNLPLTPATEDEVIPTEDVIEEVENDDTEDVVEDDDDDDDDDEVTEDDDDDVLEGAIDTDEDTEND